MILFLKKMDKLFLRIFGQELFNVFMVELMIVTVVGSIFLIVSLAVSWLWKIGIVLVILFGIKTAHARATNKVEALQSTPVILYD